MDINTLVELLMNGFVKKTNDQIKTVNLSFLKL